MVPRGIRRGTFAMDSTPEASGPSGPSEVTPVTRTSADADRTSEGLSGEGKASEHQVFQKAIAAWRREFSSGCEVIGR